MAIRNHRITGKDPLKGIPQASWNRFAEAADLVLDSKVRATPSKGPTAPVYWPVINADGEKRSYSLLAIQEMQISEQDNQNEFEQRPTFKGVKATEENKHKFAIMQAPSAAGQVVNAAFSGLTLAWVDIRTLDGTTHRDFAEVDVLEGYRLRSAESGGCRIIYCPPGAEGDTLCWVVLGFDEQSSEECIPTDYIYVPRLECDPNPNYIETSPGEEADCCDHTNAKGYLQEYLDYYYWDQEACNWVLSVADLANRVIACCDPDCKQYSVVPPDVPAPGCNACPDTPGQFFPSLELTTENDFYRILMQYDDVAGVWVGQINHLFTDDIDGVSQVQVVAQVFVTCTMQVGTPYFGAPNNTLGGPVAVACSWADRDNPIVDDYNEPQPGVMYHNTLTAQTTVNTIQQQCGGAQLPAEANLGIVIRLPDCQ